MIGVVHWFPLWALLLSTLAYLRPAGWLLLKPAIVPLLAMVMLAMGLTLSFDHFRQILRKPGIITLGVAIQFVVMPSAAYLIGKGLQLSQPELAGMVLVGASAGGTASNVICFLARGNVALSVLMTMSSTLLAVVATPALAYYYLHQNVPVPARQMLITILQIVLFPVGVGVVINTWLGPRLEPIKAALPLISSVAILVIIAIIVALNRDRLATAGPEIVIAVALHNLCGLVSGYWLPALLGYDRSVCRTVAIEVGMQNSGLSVALALKYFTPAAALPGALFSIWHNLTGAVLASRWRLSP